MTAPVGDDLTWLDDLERAHAAAGPGEWEVLPEEGVWEHAPSGNFGTFITSLDDLRPEHAALIVAAVNALPELIRLAREREALREKVETVAAWCEEQAASRTHFAKVDPAYRDTVIPYEAAADRLRSALTAALTPESVTT